MVRSSKYKSIVQPADYATSGVTRITYRSRDHMNGLPIEESETVQLGPGVAEFLSRQVCGRDIVVVELKLVPKFAGHVVPDGNWVVLMLPLRWRSSYLFNGFEARPFDLFLATGRDGYATSGKDRLTVAVGIRKTKLIEVCSALAGVGPEDVALKDLVLPLGFEVGNNMQHMLLSVLDQPYEITLGEGRHAMPEPVENDLISNLVTLLLPYMCSIPDRSILRPDALRIVRAAETAASQAAFDLSLDDLCRAAGVSQSWLYKSFMDVYGASPIRYLRLWRLSKARDKFLDPVVSPTSVKCIALSFGYLNSGRFAADYHSVFRENPSDTLRRTKRT